MFNVQNIITVLRSYGLTVLKNWKENLYLLSLCAFLVALPTSVAFISCTSVALLIVWLLTGDYKTKWNRLIQNRSALLLMSIPAVYLAGLCFTHHFSLGIQEFNKSLPWFIFAFVLGSSPPVTYKNTRRLLSIYILAVAIAAAVALFKFIFTDTFHFFDFRLVTWVDHIPFSYQIAFAIWIVFYFIYHENHAWYQKILLILLSIFLIITLLSLKSFTGYLYFGAISLTALFLFIRKTKKREIKITFSGLAILLLVLPIYYGYYCVQKFYDVTEYNANEIELFTKNGNRYHHNFEDKTKENGHYVGLFICEEELVPLWNAHSRKQYNSTTSDGYPLSSVILRYMTSRGVTKDAEGFAQLTPKDMENIEKEVTNYIYADNKLAIYPRIYEIIWEMDLYRMGKNPNGKTLAQRIEQAVLAIKIIKKHPWFGVGLGNNPQAYDEAIMQSASKLAPQQTGSSHNQYLNYLIRFGIVGTVYILGVLFLIFIKGRKNNAFLLTLFFVGMLAANLGEANWETFMGLNFFAFFICFLMWNAPKNIMGKENQQPLTFPKSIAFYFERLLCYFK